MKKTPKSNRSRRSSWMKKNLSANRKPTTFHLESLEPRQMLSGISFAAVNLNGDTVESDRFQVTLNDGNGTTETQYVTMNIISSSGRVIDPKDISMEGVAPVRASADSGTRVTSILYQMGFGTDYSVTVDNLQDGETLSVFFTVLGDKDGNGLTEQEYYEAFGEAMKSKGLNSQSVKIFKNKYGVDITQDHFDTLWDLNSDGKFTLEEFDVLFSENTITVDLQQIITTSPDIRDLKVNGETPREDGLVAGSELELSGTLSEMDTTHPVWAQVTVGETTETINLTELADSSGNFTWNVADTIALADGDKVEIILYGGKCETAVNDPSANSWSFTLDATAPAITATEVLTVNGQEAFEGKFYGKYDDDGNLNFEIQFTTDLEEAAFLAMLEEEGNGLYIDVVIANASGTPVFTATNYQVTKDRVTNYLLSLSISQKDTKLADGEYTLTVTPHDLAGNTVAETTATLVVDSTAPVAADVLTTYTEKTNPGSVTADYYTDGKFSGDSADVTLGFANGEKGTIHYSLDGGGNWLSSGDTFVEELTLAPEWGAGTNAVQYYLVDWAGNALGSETEPLTWTCIINTAPVLSTAGETLETDGLTQLEREGAEKVTVTLADQFTNDDGGAMTYEDITSSNDRVTVTNNNGILEFAFATLGEDEVSYSATISVTAKDQYGETCKLTFDLEYTKDNEAPQAGNVRIEDGAGNRLDSTGWNETGYDIILAQQASTPAELWLTGTIEDISEIKSFTVVWGDSSYAVANPAADFTSTDNIFSYNAADKSFKIIMGITEGTYSLKVYGEDEHGNVTTAGTAQETTILVDFTAPTATIDSITVDGKSTTAKVYTNDTTPTVTVAVSDVNEDTWVQLWNGETLLGSDKVANGSVSITLTEALAEGSYTLTVQIVDGVGNKGASQGCSVVVDTTKPVVGWNSTAFVSGQKGTETGEYYTTNSSQKVLLSLTEANQTGGFWTINGGSVAYADDGLALVQGENAFTATYTDAAGNVSDTLSFTVILNDVPVAVAEKQADSVQDDGGNDSYKKTYDLSKWFTDVVGTLTYSVSGGADGITADVDGNTLTVDFSAWANDITKYGDYTFTITATDSYDEKATTNLVITYTDDSLPPQWGDIKVNGQPAKEWNGESILTSNSLQVSIFAPVKELSGIQELYLTVLQEDGNAVTNLEKVDLLVTGASLGIYDPTTQTITLENIPVAAGTYTLILFGSDELGNTSVNADGSYAENASRVDILVDTTNPDVTLGLSAEKTLTNEQPVLTPTVDLGENYSEPNGVRVRVTCYNSSVAPAIAVYMEGFSADGKTITWGEPLETLGEGTWVFDMRVEDVAGNVTTATNLVTVIIDTTPPSAAEWEGVVLSPYAGEEGAYYTEDISRMVLAAFNERVNVTIRKGTEEFSYNDNDFNDFIGYGRNEFTVVATDLAGNVSETKFVIHYNAVPVATGNDLYSKIGTYDNGTVTFILPAYQVESLFTQADEDVDTLTYTFQIGGVPVTSELRSDGSFYDFYLTLTGVEESATSLGPISVTVTDGYGKSATFTSNDDSYKENLAPGWDSSATLENGALQVTKSQVFENISYTFDVPVADAETDVSELTLTEGDSDQGTYSFAWDENRSVWTCTFTPTDGNFTGTVSLPFTLTDVGYGGDNASSPLVGAKTSSLSISLNISGVNRPPVRNETPIPAVETKAGEEETIDLTEYVQYFTDPDRDSLTVQLVDGGTATLTHVLGQTYTFTPSTYGVYTFLIQASDGEFSSASATVSIVAAGAAQITDESLNVTAQESISAGVATTTDMTLAERVTTTSNMTLGTDSVLKAGTVLKTGTFLGESNYSIPRGYREELDDGFYITADYTFTVDITTNTVVVLTAGSEIASNSLLKAGTSSVAGTTVTIVDGSKAHEIYENYRQNSNYVLTHDVPLSYAGMNLTGATASFEALPANSCFKSVAIVDGKLVISYEPYLPTQDRSSQTVLIKQADGTEIPIVISTEYEQPFHYTVNVVSKASERSVATSTSINNYAVNNIVPGEQYYLEVWIQCDLPLYANSMWNYYHENGGFVALGPGVELTVTGENLDIEFTTPSEFSNGKVVDNDGSYALKASMLFQSLGSDTYDFYGSTVDGTYARAALFSLKANGELSNGMTVTVSENSNVDLALLFTLDAGSTKGNETGVGPNGISQTSQVVIPESKTITVQQYPALKGTEAARQTVVEGNGVYLSLVKDKTESEQTQTLRESEEYLTEWDSSWVELWVNTQEEGVDLRKVLVDLGYDASLFTATDLEYGSVVEGLKVTWEDGKIVGIGGDLSQAVTNEDGFVLLARVKLESADGNGIAADNVGAVKAGLVLENIALFQVNGALVDANTQVYVNTNIFPVVYDANDDGKINITDLIAFAKQFGGSSTDSTDPRVWAMDFDKSGQINITDLIAFAKNFGLTKADADSIVYPERFMEQWIGSMKIGTGDANVANLLETAIRQWETKLNEALQIDVQIIVKDLDDTDKILGQTVLVGLDENGAPNTAVVYLDDDALGQGWFVSEDGLIPSDQYDLYTVLLHELGHALGFNASYTGYTDTLDTPITYTDDAGEKHYLRPDGHVEDNRDDLMYFEINPGQRKEISDLDAEILRKAREQGGVIGEQYLYALQGSVSDAVSEEVTSEIVVSTMMEESQWNALLVSAVTEEVRKVEGAATDKAWETIDSELLETDNSQRATTTSEDVDWLEEDDSLESLLEDIATEPLRVKLEK